MKTIELIKKLAELGRLVEIWENPTMEDCFNLGWRLNGKSKYLFFIRGGEVKKDTSPRDIFNHICTQKAFKAEVHKVAGGIARDFDFLKHFYKIDTYDSCYLDLSFDDLFKTLLESASKQEKFFCLSAICLKMGVELESEGA